MKKYFISLTIFSSLLIYGCFSIKYNIYEYNILSSDQHSPSIIGINDTNFILFNPNGYYCTGHLKRIDEFKSKNVIDSASIIHIIGDGLVEHESVSLGKIKDKFELVFDSIPFNTKKNQIKYEHLKQISDENMQVRIRDIKVPIYFNGFGHKSYISKDTQFILPKSNINSYRDISISTVFRVGQMDLFNGYMDSNLLKCEIDSNKIIHNNLITIDCLNAEYYFYFNKGQNIKNNSIDTCLISLYSKSKFLKFNIQNRSRILQKEHSRKSIILWNEYRNSDLLWLLKIRRK